MNVSFKARAIDTWYCFSYLATKTITGRCLLAFLLVFPVVGPAVAWYNTIPGSKAEHFMRLAFLPGILGTDVLLAFSLFLGILLGTVVLPLTTMAIDPQFCYRVGFFKSKSSWRAFSTLTEEADYFYLMGWRRTFYIPKRAFDSRAEAELFFQTALTYWHEAKGTKPSIAETVGVWPPAPRSGNPVEPGDTPSC